MRNLALTRLPTPTSPATDLVTTTSKLLLFPDSVEPSPSHGKTVLLGYG